MTEVVARTYRDSSIYFVASLSAAGSQLVQDVFSCRHTHRQRRLAEWLNFVTQNVFSCRHTHRQQRLAEWLNFVIQNIFSCRHTQTAETG